jgi:hypothetical protein
LLTPAKEGAGGISYHSLRKGANPVEVRLQPRQGHLQVEVMGPYESAAARGAIGQIRSECARLGLKRVIVDARGLQAAVSIADRFELARALAEGCTAAVRYAILVRPDQLVTKTREDTAVNRGVPVQTTASVEAAYGFLGIEPPG